MQWWASIPWSFLAGARMWARSYLRYHPGNILGHLLSSWLQTASHTYEWWKGQFMVKSHPCLSRACLQHLCPTVELLAGLLFTVEADQGPALLLEVSAPLIQLCSAPQWLIAWPEGEVAWQPLMASFWSLAPSPAGLCGMLRTPSCNTSHSGCVRAVTRARGGGLQHAVTHSFVSVSPRQQLPLRIILKHRVWSLEP